MKQKLLHYLCCPICHENLSLVDPAYLADEITSAMLVCAKHTDHRFPVIDGVPRFVQSKILDDKQATTIRNFGFSWNTFDSKWENDEQAFLDFIHPITPAFFQDKIILDAGCGMGRFLYLAHKFGAKDVIGVDMSSAVDAAHRNFKEFENIHIVQADIHHLPFKTDVIEFAYSVGVLHHLPHPESGFRKIVSILKSGATIAVWVYGKEGNGWITNLITPVREHITSRMPMPLLYVVSISTGFILWCILRMIYLPLNIYFPQFSKRLPYNHYFKFMMTETLKQSILTVLDHLLAPIAYYLSEQEVRSWFQHDGLELLSIHHLRNYSWTAIGKLNAKTAP